MRFILFFYFILNLVYVPFYFSRSSGAIVSTGYTFIFDMGRAQVDITRLIIQSVVLLTLIGVTFHPNFKKFEEGDSDWLRIYEIVRQVLLIGCGLSLIFIITHEYF